MRRSRGFESLAAVPDGSRLIVAFEGPLLDAQAKPEDGGIRFLELDVASRHWTGRQWRYQLEDPQNVLGDMAMVDATGAVVIERDDVSEGSPFRACKGEPRPDCFNRPAQFKRVYRIVLQDDGTARKTGYIDLLNIADPNNKAHAAKEPDGRFMLPFQGPEGVAVVDAETIAVVNDNNFPYNSGRTIGEPDDTEIALLHVPGLMRAR